MAHRNRSLSRAATVGLAAAALALLTGCTATAHSTPPIAAPSPAVSASAGHTTAGSPPKSGGCRSLTVPATVKASVTRAYGDQAQPRLTHIAPVKGTFYYGSCDGTFYAATRFQPTPGSTAAEQVALQDDGAAMKYFVDRPGTGWTYVASDGFPASPQGCAAITRIPASLAALWDDCRSTG
ncbi:hypothetical protein AB0D34_04760 [Streptomyces sp. NPDC048420]|uniref:hypothetical protein n=1 Tax=Streptomyces sp. NPDC048420 TaxID=3155755 RepID=UPI0034441C2D